MNMNKMPQADLAFEIESSDTPTTDAAPETNVDDTPAADITPVIETDDFDRGLNWRPTPNWEDENEPILLTCYCYIWC